MAPGNGALSGELNVSMGTLYRSLLHEKATADGSGRCSASPTTVIKMMKALPSLHWIQKGLDVGVVFQLLWGVAYL